MRAPAQQNARRRIGAATAPPCRYRPIAELPDVAMRTVVLWNDRNGPQLCLLLADEAEACRESGAWTHFILLPRDAA